MANGAPLDVVRFCQPPFLHSSLSEELRALAGLRGACRPTDHQQRERCRQSDLPPVTSDRTFIVCSPLSHWVYVEWVDLSTVRVWGWRKPPSSMRWRAYRPEHRDRAFPGATTRVARGLVGRSRVAWVLISALLIAVTTWAVSVVQDKPLSRVQLVALPLFAFVVLVLVALSIVYVIA